MTVDVSLLEQLKQISPFVAIALIIAFVVDRVLKFLLERKKQDVASEVSRLATLTTQVVDGQAQMLTKITAMEQQRVDEGTQLRSVFEGMLVSSDRMVKELIAMKALQQGSQVMASEEAKLLIEYQWAWCRGEVVRIILNSIDNNHFRGEEDRVARFVQRAWRVASENAVRSLTRFSSLQYPYSPLFEVILPMLLGKVWKLAIPLYHSSTRSHGFDAQVEDFKGTANDMFDNALEEYFREVEDIEGPMYGTTPPAMSPEEQEETAYRSKMLSAYKEGGRGIPSGEFDMRKAVKELSHEIHRLTPPSSFPVVRGPDSH